MDRLWTIKLFYQNIFIIDQLGYFLNEATAWADKSTKVILVANKCDLTEKRIVSFETGKLFASANNLDYFEVSCKSLEQTEFVFVSLVSSILAGRNEQSKDMPLKQSGLFQTASRSSFSCCYLL